MNYHKLITKNFTKNVEIQHVNEKHIIEVLDDTYKNTAFSTFPYIMHNMNSKTAIKLFKSGNCIALAMFVKDSLWSKFGIKSYLIPATIPKKYKFSTYLDICHVALCIPKNKKEYFIADPAFYFLNPIILNLDRENNDIVFSKDIYQFEPSNNLKNYISIEKISSINFINKNKYVFNEYQTISRNTIICKCNYINDPYDTWCYFLTEVINPDRAISTFFINTRKMPFICSTKIDKNGVCVGDYYIKMLGSGSFKLSVESKPGIDYRLNNLSQESINKIEKKCLKFFRGNLKKYLAEKNLHTKTYIIND